MTTQIRGKFDVKLTPQPWGLDDDSGLLGRRTIDKRFHGDLDATSTGQMLSAGTAVNGSAGYVAIERVRGTLGGRRGTFVLQHSGSMSRGEKSLVVSVVPDSGTDELEGLSGDMAIDIIDGQHYYTFAYALPERDRAGR